MTPFHLISHDLCPYVQRAVIVLREKQIPYRRTDIDLAAKPTWFTAISPLGKVPVLETEGSALFESQVISEYLDEITPGSLHPEDPLEKARHRSWIEFGSQTLNTIGALYSAQDQGAFATQREALIGKLARVEAELTLPFFAGERFHMVDGVWATIFRYFDTFDRLMAEPMLKDMPKIAAWRASLSARPSVQQAAPADYPERLERFLARRDSLITRDRQLVA